MRRWLASFFVIAVIVGGSPRTIAAQSLAELHCNAAQELLRNPVLGWAKARIAKSEARAAIASLRDVDVGLWRFVSQSIDAAYRDLDGYDALSERLSNGKWREDCLRAAAGLRG